VKKVVDIPVITVGRINDPFYAETTLKAGKADFISMARASLADPYLPNKTAAGAYDDIVRCIGCAQGCPYTGQPMRCVVNPMLGREYEFDLTPVQKTKKIIVVGGGISGCEAAIFAAHRGHDVTLYEKSGDLGGQFNLAAVPPGKVEISSFVFWQKNQIRKLGVNVIFNTQPSAEEILSRNPDAVIVATGSVPFAPLIKGLEQANVIDSHEYLAGKAMAAGSKVLVVGGGMVGAETAHLLCTYNKAVTVVDMLPEMATSMQKNIRKNLFGALKNYGAQLYVNTAVKEITRHGVIVTADGVEKNLGIFDTIVMACGVKANNTLEQQLSGKVAVYSAGDAVQARTALEAIKEGFEVAMKL
jgi:NADPH-dependent 2,4-dienoyl-CoA reductase/sulfur reductase-like enzyme